MTKFINAGDTIEAEYADARSMRIEWKGLRKHPVTKERMTLYECDRNAMVEIIKACTGEIKAGAEQFHRAVGDTLEAYAISIYIDSPRKEKVYVQGGASGRHKAQCMDIRKRCIATIKYPLRNLIEATHTQ